MDFHLIELFLMPPRHFALGRAPAESIGSHGGGTTGKPPTGDDKGTQLILAFCRRALVTKKSRRPRLIGVKTGWLGEVVIRLTCVQDRVLR